MTCSCVVIVAGLPVGNPICLIIQHLLFSLLHYMSCSLHQNQDLQFLLNCFQVFVYFYPVSLSSRQLPAAADAMVMCSVLLLCFRDVWSSDLSLVIAYLDWGFCGLAQSLHTNGGIVPQISQWPFPCISLHIHYLCVILQYGRAESELLRDL